MKKIVSTQGLLYGHFDEINLNNAIRERINPKLEYYYNFHDFTDGDVHVDSKLSYDLMEGQVTSILLSYTIDNPSHQRLEDFRSICECFFELYGFMIDYDDRIPSVFYRATDLYEMACLIHALEYLSVSLEGITLMVAPAMSTSSTTAVGVSFPVLPTSQIISFMVVVISSAGNL